MAKTPLAERFWRKVRKDDVCWNWTGSKDRKGYGTIFLSRGESPGKAHRVAYELLIGPIPAGLQLDHLCRNTSCVNPDHLEPVTNAENKARGYQPTPEKARLTYQQVREIRYRRNAGERGVDLAEEFGLTEQNICNIIKGRLYARAGGPLTLEDQRL